MRTRYAISFPLSHYTQAEDLITSLQTISGLGVKGITFTVTTSPTHYHIYVSIGVLEIPMLNANSPAKRATWLRVPLAPLTWLGLRTAGVPGLILPSTWKLPSNRRNFAKIVRRGVSLRMARIRPRRATPYTLVHARAKEWHACIDTTHRIHERSYYGSRLS